MILFLILFCIYFADCIDKFPLYKVKAEKHYDAFLNVGKNFKNHIQSFVQNYAALDDVLIPFYQKNESIYNSWKEGVEKWKPEYIDEIKGLADGSGVDFYKILLLNFRAEIFALTDPLKTRDPECTDIFYNSNEESSMRHIRGHNEDGDYVNKEYSFLVDVEITESNERFFSYVYPGVLPGIAFGWNKHGMVISGNAVFPQNVVLGHTIPKTFIYRYSLTAESIIDALSKFQDIENRAYGVTIDFGSLKTRKQVSIEISPYEMAIRNVINSNYSHVNNYKMLSQLGTPFFYEPSSNHRQKRINEFEPWKSEHEILDILGDQKDTEYPLYRTRNENSTSDMVTLATVFFDMDKATADIYISNPKSSSPAQSYSLKLD